MDNPKAGKVIQGTGGFRKIRWYNKSNRKGKRGGFRIIYYHFISEHQIWLFTIYKKGEVNDLTNEQKKAMKQAITLEKRLRSKKC